MSASSTSISVKPFARGRAGATAGAAAGAAGREGSALARIAVLVDEGHVDGDLSAHVDGLVRAVLSRGRAALAAGDEDLPVDDVHVAVARGHPLLADLQPALVGARLDERVDLLEVDALLVGQERLGEHRLPRPEAE